MLEDIKVMANKRDVPYQSLMKVIIADAIARERQTNKGK
jgi:predicted DNA binding CopG/RHH family protein